MTGVLYGLGTSVKVAALIEAGFSRSRLARPLAGHSGHRSGSVTSGRVAAVTSRPSSSGAHRRDV